MRPQTRNRTAKLGTAAMVSFALLAAACSGGSDSGGDGAATDDSGSTATSDTATSDTATSDTENGDESDTTDTPVISEGHIEEDIIEEPQEEATSGGTLRYAVEGDVDGLNPTTSALTASGMTMAGTVFDTVVAIDTEGNAVPYLAESIEPVDGDFSKWQLKLREGIMFHDGTPLNAAALQINFETLRTNPLTGLANRPYYPEENASEIIDDLTLQYNLLEPYAVFPKSLSGQQGMVASPTWLAAATEDPTLNQKPVGTGPFVFDSRSPDSVTRVVRNDDWWGGEVYLDAIEFLPVVDAATRNDLLLSGDVQALHTADAASGAELRDDDSIQNVVDETGEEIFVMINSEAPPFDDPRARMALTFATPRQNYIDLIGLGIARGADQMFIPESVYYNPDVIQEGDMPDEAAALVAEYCADRGSEENPILGTPTCTDGKINMEYQFAGPSVTGTRAAEILDEGWKNSFNVTFDELALDANVQALVLGQYNVTLSRQFGAVDPAIDRIWIMCRNIGAISINWPRYCDEERDAIINEAQATTDPDIRIPLYKELSQNLHDAYTYVFLTHTIWDNAADDSVRGLCDRTSPDGTLLRCVVLGRTWFDSAWLAD